MGHRQSGWSAGAGRGASLVAALLVAGTGLSAIARPRSPPGRPGHPLHRRPTRSPPAAGSVRSPVTGPRPPSPGIWSRPSVSAPSPAVTGWPFRPATAASVPTPLILLFHGSGSNAVQTSVYTQMPKRASRAGYLVATPDGVDGKWQVSAPGATTDDLEFVSALIADLSARYCVDRTRIYAAGISLGSEFSAIVGCTPADHIAAVGLVAAEFLLRPCTGPVPVIAFHGTADPIVAYRSGATGAALPGIPVIGVEQNLAHWARLDRCRAPPATPTGGLRGGPPQLDAVCRRERGGALLGGGRGSHLARLPHHPVGVALRTHQPADRRHRPHVGLLRPPPAGPPLTSPGCTPRRPHSII